MVHVAVQPSPLTLLLSSHASPVSRVPLPQGSEVQGPPSQRTGPPSPPPSVPPSVLGLPSLPLPPQEDAIIEKRREASTRLASRVPTGGTVAMDTDAGSARGACQRGCASALPHPL